MNTIPPKDIGCSKHLSVGTYAIEKLVKKLYLRKVVYGCCKPIITRLMLNPGFKYRGRVGVDNI